MAVVHVVVVGCTGWGAMVVEVKHIVDTILSLAQPTSHPITTLGQ